MTAAHVHLMAVHLPIVLCPVACCLMAAGAWRRQEALVQAGYVAQIVAAATAAVAFVSGPWALEIVQTRLAADQNLVEDHAVIARAAFILTLLAGVAALQALLQFAQEEPPALWLRRTLLALALFCCYLLAWSAHLGGQLSHPEIREPASWFFPRLSE